MKRSRAVIHALALALAALAPLLRPTRPVEAVAPDLPEFPSTLEGRPLVPSAPSELEAPFLARFSGRIGRFTDGERLWILRQTAEPTLALHSSTRCLRAAGWELEPARAWRDEQGRIWSACTARLGERTLFVRERVESSATGASWSDVDAWRFDAWLGRDPGPWCAYTAIELVQRR